MIVFPLVLGTTFSVFGLFMLIAHFLNINVIKMDNLGVPTILMGLTLIGLSRSLSRSSTGRRRNIVVVVSLAVILGLTNWILARLSLNDFNIYFVADAIIYSILTLFASNFFPAERKALNWINGAILLSFLCVLVIKVLET